MKRMIDWEKKEIVWKEGGTRKRDRKKGNKKERELWNSRDVGERGRKKTTNER